MDKETQGEKDVSTEQQKAGTPARIPPPDVDAWRSSGHSQQAGQGSPPPVRLIWRVRDQLTLHHLPRKGHRGRGEIVMVSFLPGDPPPRIAFALTRKIGTAPTRNRVRRRLLECLRSLDRAGMLRDGAYLLSAVPGVSDLDFDALRADLHRALEQAGAFQ